MVIGQRVIAQLGQKMPAEAGQDAQPNSRSGYVQAIDLDGDVRDRVTRLVDRRQAAARVPLAAGERASRDLDFATGFTLRGTVSWNGAPLPGTDIALRGLDNADERQVRSNHEGAFRLDNLRQGSYRVDASNHRELLAQNLDLAIDGDRELAIEFDTARVAGRVTTQGEGEGIADALVFLQRRVAESTEPGSISTLGTKPDGTFEFGRLALGLYDLTVRRDGFAPLERQLEVDGDVGPLVLELLPAAGLDLLVRRQDGRVPPHVFVSVLGENGGPRQVVGRDLTAGGLAQLPTLAAGRWRLWIAAPGAVPAQVDVESRPKLRCRSSWRPAAHSPCGSTPWCAAAEWRR